jgi:hypothetical protein
MVPGTNWSRELKGAITDPVRRANVVYKSHPYNSSAQFQNQFGDTYDSGLPVFIGEFGPWPARAPAMTMSDVTSLLNFTRTRKIGWAAWVFDWDHDALITKALVPTTPYGTTIKNEMVTTPPLPISSSTVTSIDDSVMGSGINQFSYTGFGWQHCTACNENGVKFYNASQSWSDTAGDTVSIGFIGRQIKLYGVQGPWHGIAAVFIDNVFQANVDFYSGSKVGNVLLWTSSVLTSGSHTFELNVTGTRNINSTGAVIPIDRIEVAT